MIKIILLLTIITTTLSISYFCEMFFFFGFFNPVIFLGTMPCLLLKKFVGEDLKDKITSMWFLTTCVIIVITTIIMFIMS